MNIRFEHESNLKWLGEYMIALWFYELNVQKRFAKISPVTSSNIFSYAISFRKFLQCARTLKNFLVASSNHLNVNISDKNIVWREKLLCYWVHLRLKSCFVLFIWMYKLEAMKSMVYMAYIFKSKNSIYIFIQVVQYY